MSNSNAATQDFNGEAIRTATEVSEVFGRFHAEATNPQRKKPNASNGSETASNAAGESDTATGSSSTTNYDIRSTTSHSQYTGGSYYTRGSNA